MRTHVLAIAFTLGLAGPATAQVFQLLEPVGFHRGSAALTVSGDGRIVGGRIGEDGGFWDLVEGTAVHLPNLSTGGHFFPQGSVAGLSFDGRFKVGAVSTDPPFVIEPVRWDGVDPQLLNVGLGLSIATGVSGDGATVGGWFFRWTEAGGVEPLDGFYVEAVSRDGSTLVGERDSRATRWTVEGGFEDLGPWPGGEVSRSGATGVSGDGSVVVGFVNEPSVGGHAFLWTAEDGMRDLDAIAGPSFLGYAASVSDDGRVVIGSAGYVNYPFIWDRLHGMQPLFDYVEATTGIDLPERHDPVVTDVSADGLTIVGHDEGVANHFPLQDPRGFVIVLPHRPGDVIRIDLRPEHETNVVRPDRPGLVRVAVFGASYFDVEGIDASSLAFGPGAAAPWRVGRPGDRDGDGHPDVVLTFRSDALGLVSGDDEACLGGRTVAGMPFEGCDAVVVGSGCFATVQLAALLPLALLGLARRRGHT